MNTITSLGLMALGAVGLWALGHGPGEALPVALAGIALSPAAAFLRPDHDDGPRDEGAWRVLPFEGAFELSYTDATGQWSVRRLISREVKIGPGKVLLGGFDMATGEYRGFRADRIVRLHDAETGETVDRNIVDWLMKRASARRLPKPAAPDATAG
ncbi:hypothetical protein [Salinarimonas soli]|uniref:hypothetical protein n=1 Tax=Salinarimonas soli TaxID=1638099 RepID=UPI001F0A92E9|nr:hypothetical protein [Salinarimonas soli]